MAKTVVRTGNELTRILQTRYPLKTGGWSPWGRVNEIFGENPVKLQKAIDDALADWNRATQDGLGYFYGWQFRVV